MCVGFCFFFSTPPLSLSIPPAANSWLQACISEGSPGAKWGDALHGVGLGAEQREERRVLYFCLYLCCFFSFKASALGWERWGWIAAWHVAPSCGPEPGQGPVVGAAWAVALGGHHVRGFKLRVLQ